MDENLFVLKRSQKNEFFSASKIVNFQQQNDFSGSRNDFFVHKQHCWHQTLFFSSSKYSIKQHKIVLQNKIAYPCVTRQFQLIALLGPKKVIEKTNLCFASTKPNQNLDFADFFSVRRQSIFCCGFLTRPIVFAHTIHKRIINSISDTARPTESVSEQNK